MITLKSAEHLTLMRVAGDVAAKTLTMISEHIVPGISTKKLDEIIYDFIVAHSCSPACLNYQVRDKKFPASSCISVNHEAVHCVPSSASILKEGDVVKVDLVVDYKGFKADTAKTFFIPPISDKTKQLISVCQESLYRGIAKALPGNKVEDISGAIEDYVRPFGFGIAKDFVGHGIGQGIHEPPRIPSIRQRRDTPVLYPGMTICIEPILFSTPTAGIIENGWNTWATDGLPVAHYEHTIAINDKSPEILTLRPEEKGRDELRTANGREELNP